MDERDRKEMEEGVCSGNQELLVIPSKDKRSGVEEKCAKPLKAPLDHRVMSSEKARLVYNPKIREVPGKRLEILGSREDQSVIAWGFWGGVTLGLLALYLVFFRGSSGLGSMGELLLFCALLLVGMVLLKLGKRSSLRESVLMEVDLVGGSLNWPTEYAESQLDVTAGEVEAVIYGMTLFSVSSAKNATPVQAFGVSLRDRRGELLPVIEASPDKEGTLQVAKLLSGLLKMPLTYAGAGVDEDRPRRGEPSI